MYYSNVMLSTALLVIAILLVAGDMFFLGRCWSGRDPEQPQEEDDDPDWVRTREFIDLEETKL